MVDLLVCNRRLRREEQTVLAKSCRERVEEWDAEQVGE
jgi:hypothetical protein